MLRQGRPEDFETVVSIREGVALDVDRLNDPGYRMQIQAAGFLLPTRLSREVFESDLPGYIITEEPSGVTGYLCLHDYQSWKPERIDSVDWLRPELRDIYFASPHAYIYSMATNREVQRQGTAGLLLLKAEERARTSGASWLFSMIVTSPVTNIASMLFHEKHEFERIAQTRPAHDAGLDGFVNLLYGKRLA